MADIAEDLPVCHTCGGLIADEAFLGPDGAATVAVCPQNHEAEPIYAITSGS